MISAPSPIHAIRSTVLVSSLLFGTSPFLRASWSFFGVGFSVLSPLSFLSAMSASEQGTQGLQCDAAARQQVVLQQLHQADDLDQDDPGGRDRLERLRKR